MSRPVPDRSDHDPGGAGTALHLYMQFADYRLAKQDRRNSSAFFWKKAFDAGTGGSGQPEKIERFFSKRALPADGAV